MRRAGRALLWGAAAIAAFAAGAGSAWIATGKSSNAGGRGPGPWRSAAGIGSAHATMFTRATVARTGLWGLPDSEVLYFNAEHDDRGALLDSRCSYEVKGKGDLPARWWSIGAYVDYHWVPNPGNRYSWTSTNLARDLGGGYTIRVSRQRQPGNWLPLGTRDGRVTLLARLYQPAPGVAADLDQVPLPTVRKLACA